jgi:hypothetical protein
VDLLFGATDQVALTSKNWYNQKEIIYRSIITQSMDIWEVAHEVVSENDAEELQRRRNERLANCGKVSFVMELPDGGRRMTWWRCRDPRCEYCNEIKGKQLRKRVEHALEQSGNVYYVTVDKITADKLCRKLGRDNYLRIPTLDYDLVFCTSDCTNIDDETLDEFDWTDLATRGTERIMSGNLGKFQDEEPVGEYEVEVQDIIVNYPHIAEIAYIKTCAEVIVYQQPESLEEHQSIRNYFNGCYLKNITAMGGRILGVRYRHTRIQNFSIHLINYKLEYDPPIIQPVYSERNSTVILG